MNRTTPTVTSAPRRRIATMRPSVIAAIALAVLAIAPTTTAARSEHGARLSMGEARFATGQMAGAFVERMTPPGSNGRTVVGKCHRKTVALVSCRFAAYGDEDVCRGWTHVLDQGAEGEAVGWTTRLRCGSATR